MIQVVYYRTYNRVTVEGHAASGEFGRDLVCASASALALTLADNVQALGSAGHVRAFTTELQPGKAEISCSPVSRWKNIVTVIFDAVCLGFDRLSKLYPDFITYEIR